MTGHRIAVIRLGSLGDIVQALGPMKAIRLAHAQDHITAITTAPYASLLRASGLFDEVWTDGRPRDGAGLAALVGRMRAARFVRVYDLQTSTRSSVYLWALFPQRPEWSGVAFLCSHPHDNPDRIAMHTVERQAEQLKIAGISEVPLSDLSFAKADLTDFALTARYALLVPGGSPHRPAKRWPAARYGELAKALLERGITPAVLGTAPEQALADTIVRAAPDTIDLIGQTDFLQMATLGRGAVAAIGNDTGPMHLLVAAGTPSLVLFSHESDPARCAPRGQRVEILREPDLADLAVESVLVALTTRLGL